MPPAPSTRCTHNVCSLQHRPFDPTQATSATGSWCWIGLPKSVLINGVGNYYDCGAWSRTSLKTLGDLGLSKVWGGAVLGLGVCSATNLGLLTHASPC